ncbi:MAG TPA: hypothetical protein DDW17_04930 [Deltaproteobacteria bacterium]|nr:hypothetical protein [Deltaproteobacteria bacterium]
MKRKIITQLILSFIFCSLFFSCGYQLVQEKGLFGGDIKSLYVPVFKNRTYEPHASLYVTDAFTRELISTGLFNINRENSDGYIDGSIKAIKVDPATLDKDGVAVEKNITLDIELALTGKDGRLIKRWTLSDTEKYRVDNLAYEDYNKKEALRRISARMARRFCSILLVDY